MGYNKSRQVRTLRVLDGKPLRGFRPCAQRYIYNIMRKTLAIIIAPLMPAILMIGGPVIVSRSWPFNDSDYIIIIIVSIIFGYLGFGIFGVPVMYWLNKINKLNLINISLAGAVSGFIVFSLFAVLLGLLLNSTASLDLGSILLGSGLGISVAVTYGVISGITIRSKPQGS